MVFRVKSLQKAFPERDGTARFFSQKNKDFEYDKLKKGRIRCQP